MSQQVGSLLLIKGNLIKNPNLCRLLPSWLQSGRADTHSGQYAGQAGG